MNIITALIIFSIIVTIHELGHFLFAKLTGVKVLEFSIGMGPRILSFTGKETKYSLKILPIGGSCSMLGEDEIFDEDKKPEEYNKSLSQQNIKDGQKQDSIETETEKQNKICESDNIAGDIGRRFTDKGPWQRFIIVFAGPLFNFVLAFLVSIILISKTGVDMPIVKATVPGFPAEQSGILEGDIISSIDNKKVYVTRDFITYLYFNNKDSHEIKVKRGDETLVFNVNTMYSNETGRNITGLQLENSIKVTGIGNIIKYSIYEVIFNIKNTLTSIKYMILGKVSAGEISGPVGIVSVIGDTITESSNYGIEVVLLSIASLIVLLSANLGIMNLLPLPALDGGRLVFILAELITGRKINKKFEAVVHIAGFVFLMILMIFLVFNDIRKLL